VGSIGSVVLFTLPRRDSSSTYAETEATNRFTRVFRCANVQVSSNRGCSSRNLLWCVNVIPSKHQTRHENGTLDITYFDAPGYLFFNDEGDGFRLTWSTEECFLVLEESYLKTVSTEYPLTNGAVASTADIISRHQTWEEMKCDIISGERVCPPIGNKALHGKELRRRDLGVVYEAFLHIDVILAEIIGKRRGISERHPDFVYNLISVHRGGRVADFIIAFFRKKKSNSLGVFVNVDLFTGVYKELDWVQSVETRDASLLQLWCNKLALNRRMKHVRAGPYSVDTKISMDWTRISKEIHTFDIDEDDDYVAGYWKDFVFSGEKTTRKPPKLITRSSLYPSCDVVTNRALVSCQPALSMQAKQSPIHLLYG
jgi:hypothetical protein